MVGLSFTGGGSFATARRSGDHDRYTIHQAGEMLRRSPGAYQSTSMATGVSIAKLKELFPNRDRAVNFLPMLRSLEPEDALIEGDQTTVGKVIAAVASHYGISRTDLTGKRRSMSVSRPRQAAMWLCRALTQASFPEIGRRLGGRDHSTIMTGVKRIEALRITDDKLKADLARLRAVLLSDTTSLDMSISEHLAAIADLEALKTCRKAMAVAQGRDGSEREPEGQ